MDPLSAALTNAWLEAVARLRAPATAVPPPVAPSHSLADVFEVALREAGAKNPGQTVDRFV